MNKIIGVIYHMGLVLMPSYRQYCWQKAMCRDRFLAILSFLHFGDGDETYTYDLKLETMRNIKGNMGNTQRNWENYR